MRLAEGHFVNTESFHHIINKARKCVYFSIGSINLPIFAVGVNSTLGVIAHGTEHLKRRHVH